MSLLTGRSNGATREDPTRSATSARTLPEVARDVERGAASGGARRRVAVPQVLVAVLIVTGCALGALVWSSSSSQRVALLALADDVGRGDRLEADDLRIVNVDVDTDISSVPASSIDNFVGSVATADLTAGTLIAPSHFSTGELLGPGEAVVGAALDDGEYPVPDLRPGDRVDAYLMPAATAANGADADLAGDEAGASPDVPDAPTGDLLDVRLIASGVEVHDVAVATNHLFVSLRVPGALAGDVAGAADLGRLRLALLPTEPGG